MGQGSTMLERYDAITRLKCFRYAFISRSAGGSNGSHSSVGGGGGELAPDSIFGRANVLTRLAYFLMDVQVCNLFLCGWRLCSLYFFLLFSFSEI